jgi:PAS domain S-box-containing protein
MSVDITEQKRVEQAVRDSEEKFRRLSESGLVSIAFFATDGRITDANDAFLEMTGYGRDDLAAGRVRWDSLTPPEWMPRTLQAVQEFESTGRIRPYEKEYLRRDGSRFWGLFGGSRLEGRSEGVAFVLDVTDRKRAEQQLREADRRKDEFLATLAHELRNPLAPIRNALHLMAHRGGNGQEIEAERAMAERQVVHLARLIDDLMDVARISRGKIELHARAVDLATVVRQAIETALPQLDERGHRLTVSLPETAVRLEADPTRLEQVLWNLLNNAAKYTEPGGSIGLTVIPDGAEVVIRVRDTGIGLEPEMLPAIFGMFVQVGQHAGRAQGGLGIGLGLVKTLVAMHGGSIAAHSAGPGLGSEFVVRLPILPESRAPAPAPTPPARAEAAARPPRRRILVVDDNVDAANSLAKLLIRIYGQDVRIAHDGLSALDVAVAFRPEVVLLDIGMPGMDGYEVARRLRSRPEFAATRLVALTGWGQQQDRMRSQEAGFDRHLVKPVDPEVVRGLLADAQHFGQIS